MAKPEGVQPGLEINQDLAFQRAEWRVQRVGRYLLAAFVLAAALGLFGSGPLSRATAGAAGASLQVEYERFVRVGATTRLVVRGSAAARDPDGGLRLRVPRRYFEAIRLEQIVPEPAAIGVGLDEVEMRFAPDAVGGKRFTVILDVEPTQIGRHAGGFAGGPGAATTFSQLAYF